MKVILVNGSPHERGCTDRALREVAAALESEGVQTEMLWIGRQPVSGCTGCGACRKLKKCVIDGDGVNEFHVVTREEIPQDKVDYFSAKAVWKDGIYVEPLCHAGSVYIFGGGHVGRALVPVLATVGFRVVMYDNREELAKKENYPMASEVIFGSFSDISGKVALTANDYAVVMTPGHQADYEILSQVLKSSATYIGCIGSRTKVAKTRERLKGDGYTEEDIARVHAPIGLPILAETPEEIAISIAAEMIEHRARLAGQRH